MKIIFLIVVILHGLVHSLGFIKAFNISDIKELTMPVSGLSGLIWMLSAILFLVYAVSFSREYRYHWILGSVAVIISQILIFNFWKDAKFGTIPNVIIAIVIVFSYGSFIFNNQIRKERSEIFSQVRQVRGDIFSRNDLKGLPVPVRKWLLRSGIVGKEKIFAAKIEQLALMKIKQDQKEWYPAKAVQYTTTNNPSFIWTVDVKMNALVSFKGRDKFIKGKGYMQIKVNSLINVVNEEGEKLDEGAVQRYLGEIVWIPSMAVSPYIRWEGIDDISAKATMNFRGTKGSGIFHFSREGDFIKFTSMRYMENRPGSGRYKWIITVDDYSVFEGLRIPSKMKVKWKLDDKDWTWLKLEIVNVKYNDIPRL